VQGARRVSVRLSTGEVADARIVGVAPSYDLAVLRMSARGGLPPPLPLGSSEDLKVGQTAFAIGNPFGLRGTMTTLDSAGRVIGVTTAILSPSGTSAGIGFAIPVDVLNRVVPELIRNGRVPIPGIGISIADESVAANAMIEQGVVVVSVLPGSPAERAGLRGIDPMRGTLGDVIVAIGGMPVDLATDLTDQLERVGVGNAATLTVMNNGARREVRVNVVDLSQGG
jgi:2-alkenal reductase